MINLGSPCSQNCIQSKFKSSLLFKNPDIFLTQIFESLSVDDMWSHFHDLFTMLVNKHVQISNTHTLLKGAKWIYNSALHKIKLKRKAWIKYKADSDTYVAKYVVNLKLKFL